MQNSAWKETQEHYSSSPPSTKRNRLQSVARFQAVQLLWVTSPSRRYVLGRVSLTGSSTRSRCDGGSATICSPKLVPGPEFGLPGALLEESRTLHEPTRFAAFQAVFKADRSDTVWSYRGLSYFERPADPTRGERLVPGVQRTASNLRSMIFSADSIAGLHGNGRRHDAPPRVR